MASASFGRLVISSESSGPPRPTRSPGRSSAGTAAMPPSPGSSLRQRTGVRPSPVLLVCSSRSQSPSPAWEPMARCSGRLGWPICICGQVARRGERESPSECERAGSEERPAREGASRCHRSGQRRIRPQARRARRGSRSRRRRPRAGSSRGWGRPGRRVQCEARRVHELGPSRSSRSVCGELRNLCSPAAFERRQIQDPIRAIPRYARARVSDPKSRRTKNVSELAGPNTRRSLLRGDRRRGCPRGWMIP